MMSETRNLERIAIALEKQVQLLKEQNILLDDIISKLEDIQGDDCSLESITRAIHNIQGDDYSLESIARAIHNIRR